MKEYTAEDLKYLQEKTLAEKIQISLGRIGEWFNYWDGAVYVSFSGGKDSTVLADLCAKWCALVGKTLYLVFVDTGLEYPEIRKHAKYFADWLREKYEIDVQLDILRPEMRFDEVIKKYGYPIISKEVSEKLRKGRGNIKSGKYSLRLAQMGVKSTDYGGLEVNEKYDYEKSKKASMFDCPKYKPLLDVDFAISEQCCNIMKKTPAEKYEKQTGRKPLIGQLASESKKRKTAWMHTGCNAFDKKRPQSNPLAFWLDQDILQYIKEREIPVASVYGQIEYAHDPEQMRWSEAIPELAVFETPEQKELKTTGCKRTGCMFCAFGCHLENGENRFELLKKTHPRQYAYCIGGGEYNAEGVWQPNKQGLGMGHVFNELNKIYGEGFVKW